MMAKFNEILESNRECAKGLLKITGIKVTIDNMINHNNRH